MLAFVIAGLLYLLCFEHVDNLGAYSIPSETGLLIPSDYNSHPVMNVLCTQPATRELHAPERFGGTLLDVVHTPQAQPLN